MNTFSQFNRLITWKSTTFLVLSILLLTQVLLSTIHAYANQSELVGLSLHSYDTNGNMMSYVVVTYMGGDEGDIVRDHVTCVNIPSGSWLHIPVSEFMAVGQTIWIRYYSSPQCNPSSGILQASPPIPQNPPSTHCWFNPDNSTTPNWSGCVNPSQTVPLTLGKIPSPTPSASSTPSGTPGLLGLSLHSYDATKQANYITITYKGADSQPHEVLCQSLPSNSWYDIPVSYFIDEGQTIKISYYSSPQCDPSSTLLQASPPIPAIPTYPHCWFNPDNSTSPNWSGCVNPSQTVPLTGSSGPVTGPVTA